MALGLVQPGDNIVTITTDTLENECIDVLHGLGCYPGKCHIELNPGAQRVIDPTRRVSQAEEVEKVRRNLKNKASSSQSTNQPTG